MVTVIIVNWNSWNLLRECIKALSKQTYKNFNVIIIDNDSRDTPPEDLQFFLPKIEIIMNQTNVGFAKANNQGVELARSSEYYFLLNPDAFPEPDCIEHLVTFANHHPEFSIFGSRLLDASDPRLFDGDGDNYHISGFAARALQGEQANEDLAPREVFSVCAAGALFRAAAFKTSGGFDSDFFCYYEDVDLCFRMKLFGYRCLQVPMARIHHIGSGSSGGAKNDFVIYHSHRNMIFTYIKNMPTGLLMAFLPLHIALIVATTTIYICRGKLLLFLSLYKDALRSLPNVLSKRRNIQSNRVSSSTSILSLMEKSLLPYQLSRRLRIFIRK